MVDGVILHKTIEAALKEHFGDLSIETVVVEYGVDEDGDDILRVQVIFDGKAKALDPRKTTSLLRHMRPKLAELGEEAFPVVSFIAKSEWKPKPEAA